MWFTLAVVAMAMAMLVRVRLGRSVAVGSRLLTMSVVARL